jgi:hypothetical protein
LQLSVVSGLHAKHELPPVPHWVCDGGETQLPAQHPFAQVVASQPAQCWLVQFIPVMHIAHDAPPVPHTVLLVPAWQWFVASQQPVAQLVESHTQAPFTQRCPEPQSVPPVPQLHAPLRQRSALLPQAAHIAPLLPHCGAVSFASATQLVPLQQPFGQLVESHTHWPLWHRWPAPHAAIPPQVHRPVFTLQPSAFAPHAVQVLPPAPHWFALGLVTQVPPEQQPDGQLTESHWHMPDTQRWPAPQVTPAPHWHMPIAQLSDIALHATHAAPPPPQAWVVGGVTQVLPEQQPDRQLVESQTQLPFMQC